MYAALMNIGGDGGSGNNNGHGNASKRDTMKAEAESSPLMPSTRHSEDDDSYPQIPKSHTLFRVGTAVTVILSLLLITIGAAMYKLGEEEAVVLRAHASLMATDSDELCILERLNQTECPVEKTKFFIPATAEGKWPNEFSFVVLKGDRFLGQTEPNRPALFQENGLYTHDEVPEGKKCKTFMSEICLHGTYTLYPYSPKTAADTGYIMACDTYRVESGEALDLTIGERGDCSELEFENPAEKLLIKQYLPDLTKPETDTRSYMRLKKPSPTPSLSSQMKASFSLSEFGFNPVEYLTGSGPSNITIGEAPSAAPTPRFAGGWPTEQPTLFPTPWPTSSWKPTKNCKFLGFFCEDDSTFAPTPAPSAHPTLLFTMSPVHDLPPELGGPPTDDTETETPSAAEPMSAQPSSEPKAAPILAKPAARPPPATEPATAAKLESMISEALAEVKSNLRGSSDKEAINLQELPAVVKPQRDGRSVLCRTVGVGCKDGESPDGGVDQTSGTPNGTDTGNTENPFGVIPAQPDNSTDPVSNFTGTGTGTGSDPPDASNSTVPSENTPTAQLTYMPSSVLTYMPSSANTMIAAREATEREQWNIQVDKKRDEAEHFNEDVDKKNEDMEKEKELKELEDKQSRREEKVKSEQAEEEKDLDAHQQKELESLREKLDKKEETLSEEDEEVIESMMRRHNATKAELQKEHEQDLEDFEENREKRLERKRNQLWNHNGTNDTDDNDDDEKDEKEKDEKQKDKEEVDDQEIPDDDQSWEDHNAAGAQAGDNEESHREDEQTDDTPDMDDAEEAKDEATDDISKLEEDDDEGVTDSKSSDANVEKADDDDEDDDDTDNTSDNKESTSIVINNEVVKKSTHKALKARKDATNWGKKLIGQESEQGAAAQIKHDGKIGINSGNKEIHDHAGFFSPAEAAVKAVHEKEAKIKKDRRENVMKDAIEDKNTIKLKQLWSSYTGK